MYRSILVTGGVGFAGSAAAIRLKQDFPNTRVVAFDNLRRRGSELNLTRIAQAGVEFVHGDVRCADDLPALAEPALIVEASAEPSAQAGYGGSPQYLVETNLNGCFHCLELARRHGADFLLLSTSRVYPVHRLKYLACHEDETRFTLLDEQEQPGVSAEGINEDFPLDGARSLYGMTKLAAELMVTEYADAYGLRTVIDRFGLIAGPWQMGKTDQGVAALWVAAHYFGRKLNYIGFGGKGKQVRDVLHVDDFCDLLVEQIGRFDRYSGGLFNVGGGVANSVSLREMTLLCEEITGRHVEISGCVETRPADVRIYVTDYRRLTDTGGWRPRRNPRTVLTDIWHWLCRNEAILRPVLGGFQT